MCVLCNLQASATVSPALELSDESYVPPPLHWNRLQACRSKRPPKVTLPARVVPDVSGIRIENRYDERTPTLARSDSHPPKEAIHPYSLHYFFTRFGAGFDLVALHT